MNDRNYTELQDNDDFPTATNTAIREIATDIKGILEGTTELAKVTIGGNQVLGEQQAAIVDSDGTLADNARAINEILAALRAHGAIASS